MSRFISALKMDFKLQMRYGFYNAAAFVSLVWIAALTALPKEHLKLALPFIIFADLGIVGLIFISGQVLFEKGERTIYALVTTPMRFKEYLWAKLISLSALAWLISIIVALFTYGTEIDFVLFSLGIILMSILVMLVGIYGVAPYSSISSYIMPLQLYLLVLNIPLLEYFGWLESMLFYLIPTKGSLLLLKGGFQPISFWEILYSVIYQIIWIAFLIRKASSRFERYIVAQKGGTV